MTLKQRIADRKAKKAAQKTRYHKAQKEYEKAAAKKLPTSERLKNKRDQALKWFRWQSAKLTELQNAMVQPERTLISPCHSSRGGVRPRIAVLHITVSHNTAGLKDIDSILTFFSHLSTQASSHIVNDAEGHDARCVRDADKAWTQAAYNPQALSIEQIEYSDKRSREDWLRYNMPQLENTAKWLAHWNKLYGIPLVHSTTHGVCQHMDLGAAGGGHSDCGPGYPLDVVLNKAREYRRLLG